MVEFTVGGLAAWCWRLGVLGARRRVLASDGTYRTHGTYMFAPMNCQPPCANCKPLTVDPLRFGLMSGTNLCVDLRGPFLNGFEIEIECGGYIEGDQLGDDKAANQDKTE